MLISWLGTSTRRSVALFLFFSAALVLHALVFWIGHSPEPRILVGDEPMYLEGAKTLAAGQTWHYESLWPPFQAIFLALIFRLTGGSVLAVEFLQTLLLGVTAWLLADFTRGILAPRTEAVQAEASRSGGARSDASQPVCIAGYVAGGLVLVYPTLAGYAHFLWPEIFHMTTLVTTGWILVRKRSSWPWVLGAGLLFGLTLCSKYLLWPFLVLALPLIAVYVGRRAPRRLLAFGLGALVVLGFVYSNDRLQVKKYPMVESAAFNAWVGLNDTSRKDFVDPIVGTHYHRYVNAPSVAERNEMMWSEIVEMTREGGLVRMVVRQMGRQYFRLFDKDSFFTDQLPGGVISGRGPGYQQTPAAVVWLLRVWSYGLYAAVLMLAVLGATVFPRPARRWSRAFLAVLAFAMLIFLVSHVKSRFRVQLMPIFFIYAGCAVAWLSARLGWMDSTTDDGDVWTETPSLRRWAPASAVAALLLLLAFGRSLF